MLAVPSARPGKSSNPDLLFAARPWAPLLGAMLLAATHWQSELVLELKPVCHLASAQHCFLTQGCTGPVDLSLCSDNRFCLVAYPSITPFTYVDPNPESKSVFD